MWVDNHFDGQSPEISGAIFAFIRVFGRSNSVATHPSIAAEILGEINNEPVYRSGLPLTKKLIPTAVASDSFWDSQIGEPLTRWLFTSVEQDRWVGRLALPVLI
jgi:hypothetical protein